MLAKAVDRRLWAVGHQLWSVDYPYIGFIGYFSLL